MMTDFIFHTTPRSELVSIIQETIKAELANIAPKQDNSNDDKLYTRKEVAKILKLSLPTLDERTKDGTIKAYRIGGNVRYKHSDVQKSLQEIGSLKYKRK